MPADLFNGRQHAGDFDFRRKGQLVVTRLFVKKAVIALSTFHKSLLQETQGRYELKQKPLVVIDYVRYMSGVDHSDQLISFFPMRKKSTKWWKKPYFHLLTLVSIQTSLTLNIHRKQHGRTVTNLAAVVKDLTISLGDKDTSHDAERDNVNLPLARVRERYFMKLCPPKNDGGKSRRHCKVCKDKAKKACVSAQEKRSKRQLSNFWCLVCNVGLCELH
ncbi:PiggyBac transposable element-derived protein 4-like [Elysia marginata]|uniref:PiggyBac transposable element-derived protein 4-like n=1 Tax=Elysia marginata TaxID=1093978 RepID=A0AAV4IF56_9GAST|nr:PiggyBac transposable element-derived protein 4-like [Elysia marginata]